MNIDHLFTRIKQCRVCGDAADGFHYSGLSCQSCKSFFRRNVVKKKNFECKNNNQNNCLVVKSTRNACQKCRMDKCCAIGMKKEMINILIEKSSSFGQIPKTISDFNLDLQPFDLVRIGEIMRAEHSYPNENHLPLVGQSNDQLYLANLTEHYVRRSIKFCKSIESFRSLKSGDQLQLMKWFFPEMTAIGMTFVYVEKKDGLQLMNETGNETIFADLEPSADLAAKGYASTFRQFSFPLRVVMQKDVTIRNLIFAQTLFKPRDDTSCPEFVKYNYYVYSHLLQKYLMSKFKCTGEQKFVSLSAALGSLGEMSKMYKEFFKEFSSNHLHELVRDLFNLSTATTNCLTN